MLTNRKRLLFSPFNLQLNCILHIKNFRLEYPLQSLANQIKYANSLNVLRGSLSKVKVNLWTGEDPNKYTIYARFIDNSNDNDKYDKAQSLATLNRPRKTLCRVC